MKKYRVPTLCVEEIRGEIVRCSGGDNDYDEELTEAVLETATWLHLAHITMGDEDE